MLSLIVITAHAGERAACQAQGACDTTADWALCDDRLQCVRGPLAGKDI